ncbi:MAG: hypothetical protein VYD87_21380 [Pseudomonadota bacterium]|nr:hypothetical protein [Pseudomonadota bacterium]
MRIRLIPAPVAANFAAAPRRGPRQRGSRLQRAAAGLAAAVAGGAAMADPQGGAGAAPPQIFDFAVQAMRPGGLGPALIRVDAAGDPAAYPGSRPGGVGEGEGRALSYSFEGLQPDRRFAARPAGPGGRAGDGAEDRAAGAAFGGAGLTFGAPDGLRFRPRAEVGYDPARGPASGFRPETGFADAENRGVQVNLRVELADDSLVEGGALRGVLTMGEHMAGWSIGASLDF